MATQKLKAQNFEMIFRDPVLPAEGGCPPLNPRQVKTQGMVIDYDLAVPMRDGIKIYIDLYRPDAGVQCPVLLAWGPYGKHGRVKYSQLGNTGIRDDDFNEHTRFEAADPIYWCGQGYAIIDADMRGSWHSEGDLTFMSPQEVDDCYDLIEWAGTQAWSNGKVGMHGVSYLAWSQWKVAAANPPHLAAINPWEGVSTLFEKGEKLRVVVQGSDIYNYPEEFHSDSHTATANQGAHVIHTGGRYDSHLLVPIIPER